MVDTTWVSLLVAGTLLLIGFAAALAFHRFRIPDFIVLLFLGAALSQIPIAPFGPGLLTALEPVLPLFTQLTIAFILFEGGLSLRLRGSGRTIAAILAHSVVAMAITAALTWVLLQYVFGLSDITALVVAIAFAGPSASVALSFASRMHLNAQAEGAIVLEGVLTNVIAVIGVLVVLAWYTNPSGFLFLPYVVQVGVAAVLGAALGFGWGRVVSRLARQRFVYIATLALAIVVYAAAQGFLAENGAVAVFVLGIALSRERSARAAVRGTTKAPGAALARDEVLAELTRFVEATDGARDDGDVRESRPAQNLRNFQAEITFALRTFFFVYLGLLLTAQWAGFGTVFAALLLVAMFVLGRLPSSALLGWGLAWDPRDTRAVFANLARGMTDVVLILFAVQSGLLPSAEVQTVLGIVPTVVLIAAIVSAALVVWAGHSPGEAETRQILRKAGRPAAANGAVPAGRAASRTESLPDPTPSVGSPRPAPPQGPPPGAAGRSLPGPRRGTPPG